MTIQYIWIICELNCLAKVGAFSDYVHSAQWQCIGTNSEGFSAKAHGQVAFQITDSNENYVPYPELTQELVVEWTKKTLGEEHIARLEQIIASDIAFITQKKAEAYPLPWNI